MYRQADLCADNVVRVAHGQVEVEGEREAEDGDDQQEEHHVRQGLTYGKRSIDANANMLMRGQAVNRISVWLYVHVHLAKHTDVETGPLEATKEVQELAPQK
jgi:hypothetical protein